MLTSGRWITDNEPSERFPLWTRGNAGEVFPNVMTPLSASLYGDAPSRAQTTAFLGMGVLLPSDLDNNGVLPLTGVFCGYLYLNLTIGRLAGVRMPGMSIDLLDTQLFGTSGAPAYRRRPGDRNLRATAKMFRFTTTMFRRPDVSYVDAARGAADTWLRSLPLPATASDSVLLELVATFRPRIRQLFDVMLQASTFAGLGRGAIEQLLKGRVPGDAGTFANRLTGGLGTIESALPAGRLWDLGRLVAANIALGERFEQGVDGLLDRIAGLSSSEGAAFLAAFHAFVDIHGHRGPDEYELASPSWAIRPELALAMIDRLRLAPPDRAPTEAGARLRAERESATAEAMAAVRRPARFLFRRALRVAVMGAAAREMAKDVCIRELSGMRAVIDELMARAQQRGGPSDRRDCFLVTDEELPAFVADPRSFAEVIATRANERDYLQARVPPFWFEGRIPDPATWEPRRPDAPLQPSPRATGVLRGIGVCGGVATGPARVVTDPGDPRGLEPGDVLVAPITDPAWTPLFLGAVAVVVDVGAQQSHAAIVSRELGIPAVVSVAGASRTIADGTWLRVNGSTGEVTVLDGPPAGSVT